MVKPVSLSNEAYDVLSKMKTTNESFSDVVLRLVEKSEKKLDVTEFFGVWKNLEGIDEMKKNIERNRINFKTRKVKF